MPRGRPFQRGRTKTGGRKAGTPNRLPRAIRDLIQDVVVDVGKGPDAEARARDYLGRLARRKNPVLFVSLLRATIEKQVRVDGPIRERVRIVNLTGLDAETLERLSRAVDRERTLP